MKSHDLGMALGIDLKFHTSMAKGLKLKVGKVLGANSSVCRSYKGKTGRDIFLAPPPS